VFSLGINGIPRLKFRKKKEITSVVKGGESMISTFVFTISPVLTHKGGRGKGGGERQWSTPGKLKADDLWVVGKKHEFDGSVFRRVYEKGGGLGIDRPCQLGGGPGKGLLIT